MCSAGFFYRLFEYELMEDVDHADGTDRQPCGKDPDYDDPASDGHGFFLKVFFIT